MLSLLEQIHCVEGNTLLYDCLFFSASVLLGWVTETAFYLPLNSFFVIHYTRKAIEMCAS